MPNVFWAAVYGSSLAFNLSTATDTLKVDSHTWTVDQSTQGVRQSILYMQWNSMILDTSTYKSIEAPGAWAMYMSSAVDSGLNVLDYSYVIGRGRKQGIVYDAQGNAKIVLMVSTPVEFPIFWGIPSVPNTPTPTDHYAITKSSPSLNAYITQRFRQSGEKPSTVYWLDEFGFREYWHDWVGPK